LEDAESLKSSKCEKVGRKNSHKANRGGFLIIEMYILRKTTITTKFFAATLGIQQ